MTLSLRNVSFGYTALPVFERFSLEVRGGGGEGGGNPLIVLGPSGCGKTSLLRLIAGLENPWSGEIRLEGEGLSFVFQESRLLPWLTALENVCLPIRRLLGKEAARERGRRFLELAGLGDRCAARPSELSGGEQQRVAIARGFAFPGSLILMDEPFQSLDIPLRIALMDLTRSLLALEDRLLIAVTHDPREAIYLGNRIILLGSRRRGIVLEERVEIPPEERRYASAESARLEERLLAALGKQ